MSHLIAYRASSASTWLRLSALVGVSGLLGCVPPPIYLWGDYEDTLYQRYANEDAAEQEARLREMVVAAELKSQVPPGVYADYGFMLYRRGDYGGAIGYFEKEKQRFPESAALMSKLIDRIRQRQENKADAVRAPEASPPKADAPL
jgi:hypothetical protein